MFCQVNDTNNEFTVYLEVALPWQNRSDVRNSNSFCYWAVSVVRYGSLPAALIIMSITTAAALAVRARFRNAKNGVGLIFLAILFLDFVNGIMCLRLFEQFNFQKVVKFNGGVSIAVVQWVAWWSIYTSWALKFFLCMYQLHRFLQSMYCLSWYPRAPAGLPVPALSRKSGWICVVVCGAVSFIQLSVMFALKEIDKRTHFMIPFMVSYSTLGSFFIFNYDISSSND